MHTCFQQSRAANGDQNASRRSLRWPESLPHQPNSPPPCFPATFRVRKRFLLSLMFDMTQLCFAVAKKRSHVRNSWPGPGWRSIFLLEFWSTKKLKHISLYKTWASKIPPILICEHMQENMLFLQQTSRRNMCPTDHIEKEQHTTHTTHNTHNTHNTQRTTHNTQQAHNTTRTQHTIHNTHNHRRFILTNAPMADLEKHVCATHMLSFIR